MKYFLLVFFLISSATHICAQEDFNFYADSIQLYAVGENHTKENAEIQIAIIDYVNSNRNVDFVFFELPRSLSPVFNEYVLHKTNEKTVDAILRIIPKQPAVNIKTILNHLAAHNSDSLNNKIEVRTVDQFGYGIPKNDAKILAALYPELKSCSVKRTVEYIFERKEYVLINDSDFFQRLLSDLNNNEAELQELLGDKFGSYKMDLEEGIRDVVIGYKAANEIREAHITSEMLKHLSDSTCAITINGSAHVTKKQDDAWFEGYPFSPTLSRVQHDFQFNTCSIVLQYPEFNERNNSNLLTLQMKEFLKHTDATYSVFHRDTLISKYPFAANRCDVVIICDL